MLPRAFGDGVRTRTTISDFGDGAGSSSNFRRFSGAGGSFGVGDRVRRYHSGSCDTIIASSLPFACSSGKGWLAVECSAGDCAFLGGVALCLDQ